jgi:hypothetical protein
MDPYSPYSKRKGHGFQERAWHRFRGCFVLLGHTKQSIQQTVGSVFEELPFLGGSYSSTNLARKSRQILVGLFGCCK